MSNLEVLNTTLYLNNSTYVNELTVEMDNHLLSTKQNNFCTYIEKHDRRKNGMALRYPGATRGHIEVDDNNLCIKKIVLYEDTCFGAIGCYSDTLNEAVKLFIGKKIEFE